MESMKRNKPMKPLRKLTKREDILKRGGRVCDHCGREIFNPKKMYCRPSCRKADIPVILKERENLIERVYNELLM
uniref:Uncharacterized protein n=1 Tax=uncultured marine virus TaxID=186617 RepID=A0A0F7L619_9VIRU|nr:hypothetical protein [uncultured marine virus]